MGPVETVVKVRESLDARHGFTDKKRFAMYEKISTTLEAVVSEMGPLRDPVGEQLNLFFPADWPQGLPSRLAVA